MKIIHDGSIIKRNGIIYIVKYLKGYGFKLFKIKEGDNKC